MDCPIPNGAMGLEQLSVIPGVVNLTGFTCSFDRISEGILGVVPKYPISIPAEVILGMEAAQEEEPVVKKGHLFLFGGGRLGGVRNWYALGGLMAGWEGFRAPQGMPFLAHAGVWANVKYGLIADRLPWRDHVGMLTYNTEAQARTVRALQAAWRAEPIELTLVRQGVQPPQGAQARANDIKRRLRERKPRELANLMISVPKLRKEFESAKERLQAMQRYNPLKALGDLIELQQRGLIQNVGASEDALTFEIPEQKIDAGTVRYYTPPCTVRQKLEGGFPEVRGLNGETYPHPHIKRRCWGHTTELTTRNREFLSTSFATNMEQYFKFLRSFLTTITGEDDPGRYNYEPFEQWCRIERDT